MALIYKNGKYYQDGKEIGLSTNSPMTAQGYTALDKAGTNATVPAAATGGLPAGLGGAVPATVPYKAPATGASQVFPGQTQTMQAQTVPLATATAPPATYGASGTTPPANLPESLKADWTKSLSGDVGAMVRINNWKTTGQLPAVPVVPVTTPTAPNVYGYDPNYKTTTTATDYANLDTIGAGTAQSGTTVTTTPTNQDRNGEMSRWLTAQGEDINSVDAWPQKTAYLMNRYIQTGDPADLAAFQANYALMKENGAIGPQPETPPVPGWKSDAELAAEAAARAAQNPVTAPKTPVQLAIEVGDWLKAQGYAGTPQADWPTSLTSLMNAYTGSGDPAALAAFQAAFAQYKPASGVGADTGAAAATNYSDMFKTIIDILNQQQAPVQGTAEPYTPATSQSELGQALQDKGMQLLNQPYGYTSEEQQAIWVNAVNQFNLTQEEDLQKLQGAYEQYGLNSGAGELGGQAGNSLQTYYGKRAQALSNLTAQMGEFFATKAQGDEQAAIQQAGAIQQQIYDQAHTDFVDTLNYLQTQDSLTNSDFQRTMQLAGLEDDQAQRDFLNQLGISDRATQDYWMGTTTAFDQSAQSQELADRLVNTDFQRQLQSAELADNLTQTDFQRQMMTAGLTDERAQRDFLNRMGISDKATQDYWMGITTAFDQGAKSQALSNETLSMLQSYVQNNTITASQYQQLVSALTTQEQGQYTDAMNNGLNQPGANTLTMALLMNMLQQGTDKNGGTGGTGGGGGVVSALVEGGKAVVDLGGKIADKAGAGAILTTVGNAIEAGTVAAGGVLPLIGGAVILGLAAYNLSRTSYPSNGGMSREILKGSGLESDPIAKYITYTASENDLIQGDMVSQNKVMSDAIVIAKAYGPAFKAATGQKRMELVATAFNELGNSEAFKNLSITTPPTAGYTDSRDPQIDIDNQQNEAFRTNMAEKYYGMFLRIANTDETKLASY